MPRYTVTEPHPTVIPNRPVMCGGRGGAGNYIKAPKTTPASGIVTEAMPLPPSGKNFYSGRGGAGNAHSSKERPVMSFDEVYKVQSHIEEKKVGFVGRGGAGNTFHRSSSSSSGSNKRKDSDTYSERSASSSGSTRSGILNRLSSIGLGGKP